MAAKKLAAKKTPTKKTATKKKTAPHKFIIGRGVGGYHIYMNDFRIAGIKPWGGGEVLAIFQCSDDDLQRAIDMKGLLK